MFAPTLAFLLAFRPEMTLALTPESMLIRHELTRDWAAHAHTPEALEECLRWQVEADYIHLNCRIEFVDILDQRHPGFPAIKRSPRAPWEPIPPDYWRFGTAPLRWMRWEVDEFRACLEKGGGYYEFGMWWGNVAHLTDRALVPPPWRLPDQPWAIPPYPAGPFGGTCPHCLPGYLEMEEDFHCRWCSHWISTTPLPPHPTCGLAGFRMRSVEVTLLSVLAQETTLTGTIRR